MGAVNGDKRAGAGVIINGSNFRLDEARWDAASIGGTDGLYFYGANAMAANGGNPLRLFSPDPWDSGSSASHLDSTFYTSEEYLMEPTIVRGSAGSRELAGIEAGVFENLVQGPTQVPHQ